MKKKFLLSLLFIIIFVGCDSTSTDNNGDSGDGSTRSDSNQDSNDNQDSGTSTNDNIVTLPSHSIKEHNQGQNCLSCHAAPANNADEENFRSGGTIYTAVDATASSQYAYNYNIRVVLENGQAFNYSKGRGTGNANSDDSRLLSYNFTAQVIDSSSNVVNSSTLNSHNSSRRDCNSCHTSTGNSAAPGRITTSNVTTTPDTTTTPDITSIPAGTFQSSILPILSTKCVACHDSNNNTSNSRFIVSDANATYTSIAGFNGIDTATPANSLLLTKAIGISHGGGSVLSSTETDYISIKDWITAGGTLGTTTTGTATTTPTGTISFANSVLPVLNSCKSCHGNNGRFTVTTAAATYDNITSFNGINTATPSNSLLLTKANGVNHGGSTQLSTTSSGYITIKDWIIQGALNN